MTAPVPRRRGRPETLTAPAREIYLKARADGATQAQAAAAVGVTDRAVRAAFARLPVFRDAEKAAAAAGRAVRRSEQLRDIMHGEGGYTNYGCRCGICTTAASAARVARRRTAAAGQGPPTGEPDRSAAPAITKINTGTAGSPQLLTLARAS